MSRSESFPKSCPRSWWKFCKYLFCLSPPSQNLFPFPPSPISTLKKMWTSNVQACQVSENFDSRNPSYEFLKNSGTLPGYCRWLKFQNCEKDNCASTRIGTNTMIMHPSNEEDFENSGAPGKKFHKIQMIKISGKFGKSWHCLLPQAVFSNFLCQINSS